MNEQNELMTLPEPNGGKVVTQPEPNGRPPADAKQMRVEAVGALLGEAYKGASMLKLKPEENKRLREDFPDTEIEIRGHDGILFIPHMSIRDRLLSVFGVGQVAEICRERFMRADANEIAVDLVLMIRGCFVAEAVGTAKYIPSNPKMTFGDVVESAWSEALRRCAKKAGIATQVWRPEFIRRWTADNAIQVNGRWCRKDLAGKAAQTPAKGRSYELKSDKPPSKFQAMKEAVQGTGQLLEEDEDGPVPF